MMLKVEEFKQAEDKTLVMDTLLTLQINQV